MLRREATAAMMEAADLNARAASIGASQSPSSLSLAGRRPASVFSRTPMPRDQLALEAGQAALPSGLLALGNAQLTLPMTRPRSRSPRRYSGRGAGGSLHGGMQISVKPPEGDLIIYSYLTLLADSQLITINL